MAIALFGQLTAIIADNCPNNGAMATSGSATSARMLMTVEMGR